METKSDQRHINNPEQGSDAMKEPFIQSSSSGTTPKGGFRTLPFIIVTDAFEKVATFGLMPNMILYLTREYGMENVQGVNVLFLWSAATNFTPLLGAFLADTYVGRFRMIAFGSIFSLLVRLI
ncbi:Protein NRT1/ PTR FAMILY 1.2 [Linum grandiflorum]